MVTDEEIGKQYTVLRIIVFALLVAAPVAYAAVIYILAKGGRMASNPESKIAYLMFALAIMNALALPVMDRIALWKTQGKLQVKKGAGIIESAQSMTIIKLALVESMYLFGMVVFFVTGVTNNLYYFAALGLLYSIIYWPTRDRFVALVRSLEEP